MLWDSLKGRVRTTLRHYDHRCEPHPPHTSRTAYIHWITLNYIGTLDYVGLHWITLDYIGLHWITLDYIGLHWIT